MLARRHGKKAATAIPEEGEEEGGVELDRRFGFSKEFTSRLEVGEEVGRGHFGYTCSARFKKGEFKGQQVAVKVIPKAKVGPFSPPSISLFLPYSHILILSSYGSHMFFVPVDGSVNLWHFNRLHTFLKLY